MRIISGKYKNKLILSEIKKAKFKYRPTSSKVRAAIFNIITHSFFPTLDDVIFADICCGSGSFGLEALSRSAKKVYFIDNQHIQIELVKKNLHNFNESRNNTVLLSEASKLPRITDICNMIFIDPPYDMKGIEKILDSLITSNWIDTHSIICVELSKKVDLAISDKWNVIDQRIYGNTKLIFLSIKE